MTDGQRDIGRRGKGGKEEAIDYCYINMSTTSSRPDLHMEIGGINNLNRGGHHPCTQVQ